MDVTDPLYSITEEVRAAGLRPRRFRAVAIAARQLGWFVVRGWMYALVKHIHWENAQAFLAFGTALTTLEDEIRGLRSECASLRDQLRAGGEVGTAEQHTMNTVRHQIDDLQATLARFTVDRAFFEQDIRTEIMAITNIVDRYRDLTESVLEHQGSRKRFGADGTLPSLLAAHPDDIDAAAGGSR